MVMVLVVVVQWLSVMRIYQLDGLQTMMILSQIVLTMIQMSVAFVVVTILVALGVPILMPATSMKMPILMMALAGQPAMVVNALMVKALKLTNVAFAMVMGLVMVNATVKAM